MWMWKENSMVGWFSNWNVGNQSCCILHDCISSTIFPPSPFYSFWNCVQEFNYLLMLFVCIWCVIAWIFSWQWPLWFRSCMTHLLLQALFLSFFYLIKAFYFGNHCSLYQQCHLSTKCKFFIFDWKQPKRNLEREIALQWFLIIAEFMIRIMVKTYTSS